MTVKASLIFTPETLQTSPWKIPVIKSRIPAGKPETIAEPLVEFIDLNKHLIKRPRTTYGFIAYGDSMVDDGIETGDMLVVEQTAVPKEGDIVIFEIDGEFTVKKHEKIGPSLYIVPGNKRMKRVKLRRGQECKAWGVVKWVLKKR
jgi:DNA polymerase V